MADLDDRSKRRAKSRVAAPEVHLADYWAIVVKRRRLIVALSRGRAWSAGVLATVLTKPCTRRRPCVDVERQAAQCPCRSRARLRTTAGRPGIPAEPDPSSCRAGRSPSASSGKLNLLADHDFNPKRYRRSSGPTRRASVPEPSRSATSSTPRSACRGFMDATIVRARASSSQLPSRRLARARGRDRERGRRRLHRLERRVAVPADRPVEPVPGDARSSRPSPRSKRRRRSFCAYGAAEGHRRRRTPAQSGRRTLDHVNRDFAAAVPDRVAKEARYQELRNDARRAMADSTGGGVATRCARPPEARARLRRQADPLQARVAGDAAAQDADRGGRARTSRPTAEDARQGASRRRAANT